MAAAVADASIAPEATAGLHVLQGPTPLRASMLWELQRNYYAQAGVKCWSDNIVPSFVTSNAFVGATYARLLLS
jgi:hypothetical protein